MKGTLPIMAASALFGKTRRAILALFFTRPDECFHLREVVRLAGSGLGAAQRELASLVAAGILLRDEKGRRRIEYAANHASPLFSELRSLMVKTAGLADVLRQALAPLAGRILVAFIFGSFARGEQQRISDVDLMVISEDLDLKELVAVMGAAEARVNREVNPILYRPAELRQRVQRKNAFLKRVLASEKIFLIGDADELTGLVEKRLAASTPTGRRRNQIAAGRGRS